MWNFETFQKIWEVWTKAFDNMEDDEKKEWFKNLIEDLDDSDTATRLKKQRDTISEEDKLKLYKRWAITLNASIKNSSPIPTYYNAIKNTTKKGIKTAAKIALLEQIPCRFFVELWILQKPESVTKKKLIKDIKKDAKNFNTYLSISSTVCACIPQARVAVPFIQMGKHYTKRYKKHWTEVLISRLNEQEKESIKEQTQEQLSHVLAA
jgi:hypothetical protein